MKIEKFVVFNKLNEMTCTRVKPFVMLKVKVALVMTVHYVTLLLYSRPQNTEEPLPVSSTLWWVSHVFASPSCGVCFH